MKSRVYFIGTIFQQNRSFKEYLLREIEAYDSINSIEYFNEADRNFYSELELRSSSSERLYVISTKKSFTLVGKLLSTRMDDKLVLKKQMLLPSTCENYSDNSYLVEVGNCSINVLQVQESTALANIRFIPQTLPQKLHFFESTIAETMEHLQSIAKQYDVLLTYSQIVEGWIEVAITCNTYGSVVKFLALVSQRYADKLIIADDLVQHIVESCVENNKKLTLAESCTGGLLAYNFTTHSGVSAIFEGSLVTYSNVLKENWLAVEPDTLVKHGAVSEAVVREMCEGALSIANADYALAISGIAGPDGGSREKPVGTVVIGVKSEHTEKIRTYHFEGDRIYVQKQSTLTALKLLVLGDKKVFFTN